MKTPDDSFDFDSSEFASFEDEVESFVEIFQRNLIKINSRIWSLQQQVHELRQSVLVLSIVAVSQLWVIIYLTRKS